MNFAEQCRRDGGQCTFVRDAESFNEHGTNTHPLQHAGDLEATAMHDCRPALSHAANLFDRFPRIFQQGAANFDNFRHEASPAVGSHPNIRLRFCMACPAAPFTRLSMAETITVFGPLATTP